MSNLLEQIIPALNTALIAIIVAFIGYLGKEVIKVVPLIVDNIVAKIGLTNYQKTRLIAMDIWNVVEEHFRLNEIIGDKVQAKVTMFESLIKQKIPGITDADIETARQAIAGEFNKDKPVIVKSVEQPTTIPIVVEPTIVYKTPDGVELKPVEISTEQVTPVQDNTVVAQ